MPDFSISFNVEKYGRKEVLAEVREQGITLQDTSRGNRFAEVTTEDIVNDVNTLPKLDNSQTLALADPAFNLDYQSLSLEMNLDMEIGLDGTLNLEAVPSAEELVQEDFKDRSPSGQNAEGDDRSADIRTSGILPDGVDNISPLSTLQSEAVRQESIATPPATYQEPEPVNTPDPIQEASEDIDFLRNRQGQFQGSRPT